MMNDSLSLLSKPVFRIITERFNRWFIPLLAILFLINLIFNFERSFYINELLSLTGFIYFIQEFSIQKIKENIILSALTVLIGYCLILAIIGFFHRDSLYSYLRTLPLFYSIFCFFLGQQFYTGLTVFHKKSFLDYAAIPIATLGILYGNTIVTPALFPFLFRFYRYRELFTFAGLLLFHFYTQELTPLLAAFVYLIVIFILHYKNFRKSLFHPITILIGFYLFIFSLVLANHFLANFFYPSVTNQNGYTLFHQIVKNNTAWRLMFWTYELYCQIIPHLLSGVGFGTTFFNPADPRAWFIVNTNATASPLFVYTLGAHNLFISIFARLGFFGIAALLCIYCSIFNKMRFSQNRLTITLFLSFVVLTVGASCNVAIVTPLYANAFWVLLGIVYQNFQAINARQLSQKN